MNLQKLFPPSETSNKFAHTFKNSCQILTRSVVNSLNLENIAFTKSFIQFVKGATIIDHYMQQ